MSDTRPKEITIRCDSFPVDINLHLTGDDVPATAELVHVVGPVSGKSKLLVNAEGKEPLIVPVKKKTDAVLVKTIGGIKQAWGIAINSKDQLIVVEGRHGEGVVDEISQHCKGKSSRSKPKDTAGTDKDEVSGNEDQHTGDKIKKEKIIKEENEGQGGDRILILSLQGEKLSSFGQKGNGDGEFESPRGVAVDDEDNIYVVDKLNSRIQKFSPSGMPLVSKGTKGHGELEFDWPKAIGIHPRTKNVYVTEASNHRVQILKPDLTFLRKIGATDQEGKPRLGAGIGEFNTPLGVAFDKAGRVYITDALNDRVQIFTENDEFIAWFGGKGKGDGQLGFPSVVCIDKNNILYVTEVDNHRISVFKIIDNTASVSPPRPRTHSLPVPSKASTNYTPPRFLTTFGTKSEPFYYGGIAVDKKGVVYVTDSCHDELQMFLI